MASRARPEPPDGAYLVVGRCPALTVHERRDGEAERLGRPWHRWFPLSGTRPPLRYVDLIRPAVT